MTEDEKQVRMRTLLLQLDEVSERMQRAFFGPSSRALVRGPNSDAWKAAAVELAESLLRGDERPPEEILRQVFLRQFLTRPPPNPADLDILKWKRASWVMLRILGLSDAPPPGSAPIS